MSADWIIDRARPADLARLPEIERAAGSLFDPSLLPAELRDDVFSVEEHRAACDAGLLWVARVSDRVVGFALVELVDGRPHLEEIDVHPAHGRRGIGRALMTAVIEWARTAGHPWITLTTFRDVPWNAPFYAKLGFRVLAAAELSAGVRAIVAAETARGLDPDRRVVMRRDLPPAARS